MEYIFIAVYLSATFLVKYKFIIICSTFYYCILSEYICGILKGILQQDVP